MVFTTSVAANQPQKIALKTTQNSSEVATPSTQPLISITVQVNWSHQFQFAGFYAVIKQGYYKKIGLDVTIKEWQIKDSIVKDVVEGRAELGVVKSNVLADYAKGSSITLVMVSFQYSPLVLLSCEPVDDLSKRPGKSVMYDNGLQVSGILNKADYAVKSSIVKFFTSGNLNDFIDRKVDFYAAIEDC